MCYNNNCNEGGDRHQMRKDKEMKIYTAKKDMGNGFSATYKVKAENVEQAKELIRKISGENLKIKEI